MVNLRQATEGAAQVVQIDLRVDGRVGRRAHTGEPVVVAGTERAVGIERHLVAVARAAEGIDARVLGDLVHPGLEGDLAIGLAHATKRGDEDLLRDVLGAPMVVNHAAHVRGDPAVIAQVEQLERSLISCAHTGD